MNGQEPLTALKGVGEKTARLFERLGVHTLEELWHYYPRAYDVFQEPRPICGLPSKFSDYIFYNFTIFN